MSGGIGGKKRRALFLVITDFPGGAERVAYALAAHVARRRGWAVEVKIVCSALAASFSKQALPADVRVSYGPSRNWYLAFPCLPFRLLFRRYDLVFTTHIYTNALASMMRRMRLIRVRRLVMRESMSLFDRFAGLKTQLFESLYRGYGGEDLLIAQTEYMADHVRRRLPERSAARLRALPNPIDLEAVQKGKREPLDAALARRLAASPSNILFCGRFVEFKRPGLALEVFRLLTEQGENAQLVFIGTGPLEPATRKKAGELGLADRVMFLGQRPNPYPVMAACQYGLLTSANEGFPNVVLEMMACRMRRIVITPCAGDLDSLSGVTVTRSHEASELAEALRIGMHSDLDVTTRYEAALEARSTARYVDRILE